MAMKGIDITKWQGNVDMDTLFDESMLSGKEETKWQKLKK